MLERINVTVKKCEISGIGKIVEMANKSNDDLIRLEIGDTDFEPPKELLKSLVRQYCCGKTHYSRFKGEEELIGAICECLKEEGYKVEKENLVITSGGSMGLFITMKTLINEDDEILILEPAWPHFKEICKMAGGKAICVQLNPQDNFSINKNIIEKHITKKTKAILINQPNNPTGRIYESKEIEIILDIIKAYNLFLICDEEYQVFQYNREIKQIADKDEKIITIRSFSKTLAVPGLRLGYIIANEKIIDNITKVSIYTNMYSSSLIQCSVAEILSITDSFVFGMKKEYEERMELLCEELEKIPNVNIRKPDGGMYVWADFSMYSSNDEEIAKFLMKNAKVVMVPGSYFGETGKGYLRISLCANKSMLLKAAKNIYNALADFQLCEN